MEIGGTSQHWSLWQQTLVFAAILLILLLSTDSKREKVLYLPKKDRRRDNFLIKDTTNKGGPGNLSAPIDVIAFRTTNLRS